jgi:hypothetical protein
LPGGGDAPIGETIVEDGSSAVFTEGAIGDSDSFAQIRTVLSCDAVAI